MPQSAVSPGVITQGAVTKGAVTKSAVAQGAVTQDAVTQDAVAQDAVGQGAVMRDTVMRDTVMRDTVMHLFYLHGFASSARSSKARFFAERLAPLGLPLHCPDFNEPDFSTLTTTRMLDQVDAAIAALPPGPVVLIGSSLGAFVAWHAAARQADAANRRPANPATRAFIARAASPTRRAAATADASATDTIATSAAGTDTGATDAAVTDVAGADAAVMNAAVTDAAVTDAAVTNVAVTNAAETDAVVTDVAVTNAAETDAAVTNLGVTNAAETDTAVTHVAVTGAAVTGPPLTGTGVAASSVTSVPAATAVAAPVTPARAGVETHPIVKLILLAPALDFGANRVREIGDEGLAQWKATDRREFFHYGYNEPRAVGYALYDDAQQYDSARARVDVPALVFQGKGDTSVDPERVRQFCADRPSMTLHLLDDDHQLLSSLDRIWTDIVGFLGLRLGLGA